MSTRARGREGYSPHGWQREESKEVRWGPGIPLKACLKWLSPARLHILKFPQPPKIAPLLGTKRSTHEPVGDTSHPNHNTFLPYSSDILPLHCTISIPRLQHLVNLASFAFPIVLCSGLHGVSCLYMWLEFDEISPMIKLDEFLVGSIHLVEIFI
jgi:hypothetical protein